MSAKIITKGLNELRDYFEQLPNVAGQAASFAINDVAGGTGMTMLRTAMEDEVAFPKGYLNKDRLGVTQHATPQRLEAVIKGRDRPTSLARFAAKGQSPQNTRKGGVRITVKPGAGKYLKGAWLVSLNNGNIGLAVRLKPGTTFTNKKDAPKVQLAPDVYLLYGPSVDQVFGEVAFEKTDDIERLVASEFFRQFARLSRG